MIIRYREIGGQVVKDVIPRTRLRGEDRPPAHFSETILKGYYAMECQQGSRFRSGYPASVTKRVWAQAKARDEASGRKR